MSPTQIEKWRSEFPFFKESAEPRGLVYLDSAATAQKPRSVIDRMVRFYTLENSNVRRGAYGLSHEASEAYEGVREQVRVQLGPGALRSEVIFTKGTTEAINLLAQSVLDTDLKTGDCIAVTRMEHHANFVPWQWVANRSGAKLLIVELNSEGRLCRESLAEVLKHRPKILAITAASNVLGTINPIREIAQLARQAGTRVVVDAAQWVAHVHADAWLEAMGPIDAFVFSAHKLFGPTGVGVLWAKEEWLEKLVPYQKGGDMIARVSDHETQWNELPSKFEAGTPNIAGVLGLGEALRFLKSLDSETRQNHETLLGGALLQGLQQIPHVKVVGPLSMKDRLAVVSFSVDGVHPHDLATYLDQKGVAVRSGHHCAQPLLAWIGGPGTVRASVAFYNSEQEVQKFLAVLVDAVRFLRKKFTLEKGQVLEAPSL